MKKRLSFFIASLISATFLFADPIVFNQGPNIPTIGADDASYGSDAWINPGNITSSDNVYATCSSIDGESSHYLKGTDYGFKIPPGALIQGIEVSIEKKISLSPPIVDDIVKMVKNGSVVGSNHKKAGAWPSSDTVFVYGSSTDLWGNFWTAADINSALFGVVIAAFNSGTSSSTLSIDHIEITVYYIFATVLYKSTIK